MDVHWLIENFERDGSISELAEEVKRQGFPRKVTEYVPFSGGDYSDIWPKEACVVFQGSIQLARQLQREKPWIPGVIATWRNYLCQVYYAHWGAFLLNNE